MHDVFVFALYFVLLLFLVTWLIKRSQLGIKTGMAISIFSFKILLGCSYGYILLRFYGGDDPWKFYQGSLVEYQILIHHPVDFFRDFLPGPYFARAQNISQGWSQYIESLEYFLMVKFLALCNLLSRGNYYIDILFFDFLVFWGPFLLFKLLWPVFPGKKTALLIGLFFIPSITFWLSGIRAEGLLLLFISLILYYTADWLTSRRFSSIIGVFLGFIGFLIFRGQFLLAFLPAFLALLLSYRRPQKAVNYFSIIYILCVCIFFSSLLVSNEKNLAVPIIRRQKEFLDLHGNTRYPLDTLQASVSSFIKVFPEAFANGLVRPSLWEARGPLQIMTAIEVIFFWVLSGMCLLIPDKEWRKILRQPLVLAFLFYGISQILLIGYVVPFPGAIVRYKAIPEFLLFLVMTILINWMKIFKLE